jgi:hypothetical protein
VSFIEFLARYYRERLQGYEQLDLGGCREAELLDVGGEASALYKFLCDLREEGYADAVSRLVVRTDAENRLRRFLQAVSQLLGPQYARAHFYLFPERVKLHPLRVGEAAGGRIFELGEYLAYLDAASDRTVEIAHCFTSVQQRGRWQAQTQVRLAEIWAFLEWILARLARGTSLVPVPLLRDTLLVQLGLMVLRCGGMGIREPKPALIGRRFAAVCGGDTRIHGTLVDGIYRILHGHGACDLAALRRYFAARVGEDPALPSRFVQASRDYLTALALDGPPLFIESGVHGTFPLWLLTLTGDVGEMVFYTTTPWLYRIYEGLVFRKNYNYLREVETLVAHEHLFQFNAMQGGTVLVEETADETARSLALYEIHAFKSLVKMRMGEVSRPSWGPIGQRDGVGV